MFRPNSVLTSVVQALRMMHRTRYIYGNWPEKGS